MAHYDNGVVQQEGEWRLSSFMEPVASPPMAIFPSKFCAAASLQKSR